MNLFALLDQTASRFGDRGALYLGEQQRNTWSDLRDRVLRLATSIGQLGPPGARVAVASENCPEIVELMFATWAADWEKRSKLRGKPNQVAGWHAGDKGSAFDWDADAAAKDAKEYMKLAGPWVNGKDPAGS